jgi:hypothetical protein
MSEIIPPEFGEFMERLYNGLPVVFIGIILMSIVTYLLFF